MDKLDKALLKYVDFFNENFPIFYYRDLKESEIIDKIEQCILKGKPEEVEYKEMIQY